jgi:hypothetical protein
LLDRIADPVPPPRFRRHRYWRGRLLTGNFRGDCERPDLRSLTLTQFERAAAE